VIEFYFCACNNLIAPRKGNTGETPVAQSHGPKAELSHGSQTTDKSKAAKRRRRKVRASKINIRMKVVQLIKTDRPPKGKIRET